MPNLNKKRLEVQEKLYAAIKFFEEADAFYTKSLKSHKKNIKQIHCFINYQKLKNKFINN